MTKAQIQTVQTPASGVNASIVAPAVTTEEAVKMWKAYQELKQKIVEDDDKQKIGDSEFLKKSYWRKLATFFNLTVEVQKEDKEQLGKTFVWHFTCKATAPNGRSAIGTGSCDIYEKAKLVNGKYVNSWGKPAVPNTLHNIRSTAETRAFNRAVSNLVGGGEVSAEEANGGEHTLSESKEASPPQTPSKKPVDDAEVVDPNEVDKALQAEEESAQDADREKKAKQLIEVIKLAKTPNELRAKVATDVRQQLLKWVPGVLKAYNEQMQKLGGAEEALEDDYPNRPNSNTKIKVGTKYYHYKHGITDSKPWAYFRPYSQEGSLMNMKTHAIWAGTSDFDELLKRYAGSQN
jgi:hypothetical protein